MRKTKKVSVILEQNSNNLLLPSSNGTIIKVRARPRSRAFKILFSDEILICCTSPAEKGKANKEILKEFSDLFKHKVKIVSGQNSRTKRILIESIRPEEVEEILLACKS